MKVVYVVTDAPPRPLRERAWDLTLTALAWLLLALAALGHVLTVTAGALDALITAAAGTRRLAYVFRLLCQAIRDSRKDIP